MFSEGQICRLAACKVRSASIFSINECLRQLNDNKYYEKQTKDLTNRIQDSIKEYTTPLFHKKLIDENTYKYLTSNPNPGRPIISSNGHPTERISQFVDYHLKPLVQKLPSYIKDTTHFLLKLQELGTLPSNAILVTVDVSSLYTNIPHKEGIEACRHFPNTRSDKSLPTERICDFIRMILGMNNLHFLQIYGTAMGTRMPPSYANLFMGKLEKEALKNAPFKPYVWWR